MDDSGANKALGAPGAYAAYAEQDNALGGQAVHCLVTQQQSAASQYGVLLNHAANIQKKTGTCWRRSLLTFYL